jgi:hypothetical protein
MEPGNDLSAVCGALPVRYSPEWYAAILPIVERAVQEASSTEQWLRLLGRQQEADLYADLAQLRRDYLQSIQPYCPAFASSESGLREGERAVTASEAAT